MTMANCPWVSIPRYLYTGGPAYKTDHFSAHPVICMCCGRMQRHLLGAAYDISGIAGYVSASADKLFSALSD